MIEFQQEGPIGILTINHPPMNTLNVEVFTSLAKHVACLKDFPELRVLIITGAGERAFVAGAEIREFLEVDEKSAYQLLEDGNEVFNQIENLPIPVIAAINGFALGGGLELALACDIRVMSESAKVGMPETKLGVFPGYGGTQRLAQLAGVGRAKELIYTGRLLRAEEAVTYQIVEYIASAEKVLDKALELARMIAENAPLAITSAKKTLQSGQHLSLEKRIQQDISYCAPLFRTEDLQNGARSFLKKEKVQFIGR